MSAETVVIGAGVAGLAAAATLRRDGREVLVLEAAPRAGGVAKTATVRGFVLERGPNTFRVNAALADFLGEHDLEPALIRASPASRKRFLLRRGALEPVPDGPAAFVTTPLLSAAGKWRVLAEPFIPRGDAAGESVAEFVRRRAGEEALTALVGPFLTGVYAGDENELGAEAVFPRLVAAERRAGSVALGLLARRERRGWRGSWSGRGGLGALAAELAGRLGGGLRCTAPVAALSQRDGAGYRVELENGEVVTAKRVVVATPADRAASLLAGLDATLAGELAAVRYVPVTSLSLGVRSDGVRRRIEGFGYLVPRGEGGLVLGCLFPSQLFAGRAPAGHELLTVLVGGERNPTVVDWPEDRLQRAVGKELDQVLGLRSEPDWLALSRWPRAVPQPGRDHPARMRRIEVALGTRPGLALAGGYLDGVAFGDAAVSGVRAAHTVVRETS